MDFSVTEEQAMIRDAAQDFLASSSDSQAVRAAMGSEAGFDEGVWQQIASELGWCGINIAEVHDGLGLGAVEVVLMLEQMGEHLLCAPFFSTVCLAANILNECADDDTRAAMLPAIASGEMIATVPLPSASQWNATGVSAHRDGEQWCVDGECARVPDALSADRLLVFADVQGEQTPGLFAIETGAQQCTVTPLESWDQTRRFARVRLDGVSAHRCDANGGSGEGQRRSLALARLYIAAESLGVAQRALDLTVAFTGERQQFGRPVAGFQAVKHRAADMMVRCEAARSAVYGAAAVAAGDVDTHTLAQECAMARTVADDAAFFCTAESIQLHGGVGFTWEYDPQLYFKRAQAARHWLGDADAVHAEIAEQVMA